MRIVLLFLSLLVSASAFGEGFTAGTLVKTIRGYTKIEDLKAGNWLICYSLNDNDLICNPLNKISKTRVKKFIRLKVGDEVIGVAPDQKFYLFSLRKWATIENIKEDANLLKVLEQDSKISYIDTIDQEVDVYIITVDDQHNFFITYSDILVHNFIGFNFIWVFGDTIEFLGFSFVGLGYLIGKTVDYLFFKKNREEKRRELEEEIRRWIDKNGYNSQEPQDPKEPKDPRNNSWPSLLPKTFKEIQDKKEKDKLARNLADLFGYKETKDYPFNSHGEPVFNKGIRYITPDIYAHKGGAWKMFIKAKRKGTWDMLLEKIIGD